MMSNPKDIANYVFLEFYSVLVCDEELFELVHIVELAKKMALIHINIIKRNKEDKQFYSEIIKEINLIK
ncbi:MAG: hypothetical protein EBR82_62265 [Caulobacteraceae bacterium]|nr:hypothetical protein [Caulobacteraceae bacterium]